jgi:hypothetical protein
LQDNIAAINFTAQSKMGKLLMAKCRTLQEENEEIGHQASEGKVMLSYSLHASKFNCHFFPFFHLIHLEVCSHVEQMKTSLPY